MPVWLPRRKSSPGLVGRDLVREVIPSQVRGWDESLSRWAFLQDERPSASDDPQKHVVALDYGMKWNIARHLRETGCRVTILPGTASADEILAHQPDGVFLSNGPGDPEPVTYAIQAIRQLLGKKPLFGICLGHQLFGLACGAKTFKLKFGHRGANQPVLNLANRSRRDHGAEPWICRRRAIVARRVGDHPPQPERQHHRRVAAL
jgi:carbamoyl-phosphate synthase small subunit